MTHIHVQIHGMLLLLVLLVHLLIILLIVLDLLHIVLLQITSIIVPDEMGFKKDCVNFF